MLNRLTFFTSIRSFFFKKQYSRDFIIILTTSALISQIFWFAAIDQDFFSFYYVGKSIDTGMSFYTDLADHKGPILYLFFAVLYAVFRDNYGWALITASTMVDAITIFYFLRFTQHYWPGIAQTSYSKIFLTLVYKSLAVAPWFTGFFSENIALMLFAIGLTVLNNKRYYPAGILMGLATLTRQSIPFYAPVVLIILIFQTHTIPVLISRLMKVGLGGVVVFLACLLFLITNSQWADIMYGLIQFNLEYGASSKFKLFHKDIPFLLMTMPHFTYVLFLSLITYGVIVLKKFTKFEKTLITSTLISGVSSVALGGIFLYHHSLFFFFFFLLAYTLISKIKIHSLFVNMMKLQFLGCFILSVVYLISSSKVYFSIISNSQTIFHGQTIKPYLHVITHYPKLYFDLQRISPDRYFQPFFLTAHHNAYPSRLEEIERHRQLMQPFLSQTTFVTILRDEFDQFVTTEYLQNFQDSFNLHETANYQYQNYQVIIYQSQVK